MSEVQKFAEFLISNPDCSPSFRPSPSDPFWLDAFATGGPSGIIAFYRSPWNTSNPSRSQALQCLLLAVTLSATISQKIYKAGYGRFRPNKSGCHLWLLGYRGGWHRYCPPLILQDICSWQKSIQSIDTWGSLITLACIVKFSRLLHPVGLGPVSQCPSRGSPSQGPYGSLAWWAFTSPTT